MALFDWNDDYYERQRKEAEEDDAKAEKLYEEGRYYYQIAHFSDAKWKFESALNLAHDQTLISDCKYMIDECAKALHDAYML